MKLTQRKAAKRKGGGGVGDKWNRCAKSQVPCQSVPTSDGYKRKRGIIIKMNLDLFARELINPQECSGWSSSALGLGKSCRLAMKNQNKTITKPLKSKPKPETIKSAANFFISPRKSFRVCPHLIPSLPEHPRPA